MIISFPFESTERLLLRCLKMLMTIGIIHHGIGQLLHVSTSTRVQVWKASCHLLCCQDLYLSSPTLCQNAHAEHRSHLLFDRWKTAMADSYLEARKSVLIGWHAALQWCLPGIMNLKTRTMRMSCLKMALAQTRRILTEVTQINLRSKMKRWIQMIREMWSMDLWHTF